MAKLTEAQKTKARSLKALRMAEGRIAARKMKKEEKTNKKQKLPSVTERTKGITNIIKKRASQPARAFKGSR